MPEVRKCGAHDSKYFGDPNGLDRDVSEKVAKTEEFKSNVRKLVLEDPNKIEQRYNNIIEVLLEIKKEFGIGI